MANISNNSGSHMDSIATFPDRLAVKEEAGAWLVRIDQGELSTEEILHLQKWVKRSDFHRQYLEKLAHNWDDMAILQELADLFPFSGHEPERKQRARPSLRVAEFLSHLRPPVLAASAIAFVLLLITVFLGQQPMQQPTQPAAQQPAQHDFVTRIGEQYTITREDGSTITLNSGGVWRMSKGDVLDFDSTAGACAVTIVDGGQFIAQGRELLGYTALDDLKIQTPGSNDQGPV